MPANRRGVTIPFTDRLRRVPRHSVKAGQQPYDGIPAQQAAAYRAAAAPTVPVPAVPAPRPAFHPAQGTARDTRPVPVLPELPRRKPVPATARAAAANERLLRWVLDGLRSYDGTAPGRSLSPVHDALTAAWQAPQGPRRTSGEHLARRISGLAGAYPPCRSVNSAYSEVLDWVSAITGTTGFVPRQWPLPALPAGDTR